MTVAVRTAVLVCGWYGTETLGDKAILGGIVRCIRNVDVDAAIDVASLQPYVTQQTSREMPELRIRDVVDLNDARGRIRSGRYACVVIGGGPLMSPIRATIDLLELLSIARTAGTATVVGACGVGPLSVSHRNAAVAGILSIADVVAVRDTDSAARARNELGVDRDIVVVPDPAFYWLVAERSSMPRTSTFLLALRDWRSTEYAITTDETRSYDVQVRFDEVVRDVATRLLDAVPGARVEPFCMHKHPIGGDDRAYYRRAFAAMPHVLRELDMRHRPPAHDVRSFLEARAVLAMRFHSVVFALATKTPFVAIDYTGGGKITGLLRNLAARGLEVPEPAALDGVRATDLTTRLIAPEAVQDIDAYAAEGEERMTASFRSVLA